MAQSIRIILPKFNLNKPTYFKGYVNISEKKELVIYITEYSINYKDITNEESDKDNVITGYCNACPRHRGMDVVHKNTLVLETREGLCVKKMTLNGKNVDKRDNCIIMLYDHEKFKCTETISDSMDYFSELQYLLKDESNRLNICSFEPVLRTPYWLSSSMFIQHMLNYVNLVNWLISTVKRDKKVTIKQGNLILAILTDVALGYFILGLLTQEKKELSAMLMGILEKLVNLLYSLLKWLMGSPAGLKLNNAFNKMLGKYFSYHIQLWWLFLDVTGEKLDIILHVYHYLGYLGLTFQAAIISDMICVATFHSYCIYVYAARLFNIQISGLVALMRLFVGRKYNPLRGGIDSCEYTNQELFVGTVAFTILLLLLPTTTMYYIVFTLFRLLSLGMQYILAKLIYLVQTLPLYVVTLWLARSPRVAGDILLEVECYEESSPLLLRVKLFNKSLQEVVNNFKPPVEAPKHFEWTNLLSNVVVGKQII
uniref:Phosphatidylinositol N-acetylglucosaminyltransferase subunit Q n=1 Tax=Pectinophora gossypiella TaxID=13191 RepID=A0A1E1WQB3_PECGO